jgi:hypothetical protein
MKLKRIIFFDNLTLKNGTPAKTNFSKKRSCIDTKSTTLWRTKCNDSGYSLRKSLKCLVYILKVCSPIRMHFIAPLAIPSYYPIVRVSESAQGPLFGRIERQLVSRAFLDPSRLGEDVAGKNLSFAYSFFSGFHKFWNNPKGPSRCSRQSPETRGTSQKFQRTGAYCDALGWSPEGSWTKETGRTIRRRIKMILPFTNLLRYPTWILGSLRENLVVLLQTQLKRPFGKAEIHTREVCKRRVVNEA